MNQDSIKFDVTLASLVYQFAKDSNVDFDIDYTDPKYDGYSSGFRFRLIFISNAVRNSKEGSSNPELVYDIINDYRVISIRKTQFLNAFKIIFHRDYEEFLKYCDDNIPNTKVLHDILPSPPLPNDYKITYLVYNFYNWIRDDKILRRRDTLERMIICHDTLSKEHLQKKFEDMFKVVFNTSYKKFLKEYKKIKFLDE